MFLNTLTQMLPFLVLGALGVATLLVAAGGLRSARRSEHLGEDRIDLLRDQAERLELLREERKTLSEEVELARRERLEAQRRVKQLTREHPHLELERELKRVMEELELEREGRLHNHRERQRLEVELEEERLGRLEDHRKAQREIGRLQQEVQDLVEELNRLWDGKREASRSSKGLWGSLFGTKSR
jgi:hypothetical protein